jgi:recombination protein RecA
LVDCGVDAGLIEKAGTWYSYKGERIGQGRESVKRLLKENEELAAQLDMEIRKELGLLPSEEAAEKVTGKVAEAAAEKTAEKPAKKVAERVGEKPAVK